MLNRSILVAVSTAGIQLGIQADSDTIQIPEGKLTSHTTVFGDITPSAGPRVIDGVGLYFTGDYLYWTAREDGLMFAVSGVQNSAAIPTQQGSKYQPRYKYESGFKFGMGFNFGHDKWDMYLNYTWFNPQNNKKNVYVSDNQPLSNTIPLAYDNQPQYPLYSAKAAWSLNFNVIDWELGRNFYVSKFLSLRPFFGFKGSWQKQKFNVEYSFLQGSGVQTNNSLFFWGAGPMIGTNSSWHFPGLWSLFADLGLSTLWSGYSVTRKDEQLDNSNYVSYNVKDYFHSIKPVMELCVGIRKESWFNHDRYHVWVQVGWEMQVWYSQNQFDFYRDTRLGDLSLQGLSAQIRFDF